jgi:DNA-binding CsgD family transcriptional regulator
MSSMNEILCLFKGYTIEPLDHLINYYSKNESSSWFVFDLTTDRCQYICPSMTNITGFESEEYINKGVVYFLNNVFHPDDHSGIISNFVPYVLYSGNNKLYTKKDKENYFSFRIKHKDKYWQRVNGICAKAFKTKKSVPDYLIGFIKKGQGKFIEQSYRTSITIREKEVLQLVGNGYSSKIIADRLNISETTAISHRKNLIQKFDVSNTAELIKEAVKAKFID